jgi:hypothetical protein
VRRYLKNNKAQKGLRVQMVENLPGKCEALSSNPVVLRKTTEKQSNIKPQIKQKIQLINAILDTLIRKIWSWLQPTI